MVNLVFSRVDTLSERYEAFTSSPLRYVSIHLDRPEEGRVIVYARHDATQEWAVVKNITTSAICNVPLDIITVPQQLRIVSYGPCPLQGSLITGNGNEGSASTDDFELLKSAVVEQQKINEEQQKQIDKNTEVNEQQERDIEDSTTLATESQVNALFGQ